ncbi:MAG: hypothetical protein PHR26_00945 [Candidatus ainarchaeum sp.]|nr:hypothetical protein [Candidatus ainarchaeum sp.]MDD3976108.1 hypothetical protein [Candidatus ainarchaeum sp.]
MFKGNISTNLKFTNKLDRLKKETIASKKITFASYPKKEVAIKYVDAFWKRYFDGSLEKSLSKRKDNHFISNYNPNVKIFPISPTVSVTVRKMNLIDVRPYFEIHKYYKEKFKNANFKYSKFVLTDIIDYKKKGDFYYVLERIVPSISVYDFYVSDFKGFKENRFSKSFQKSLEKVDLLKMKEDLGPALNELKHFINNNSKFKFRLDNSNNNIIIIDYNPETHKFKFGLIDFAGMSSKSF